MSDHFTRDPVKPPPPLREEIAAKAGRKLRARRHKERTVWFGLGMMGVIGWSVAMPTLLGAVLGLWLDRRFPGGRSWTLALLVGGLTLGCMNAWRWISMEDQAMRNEQEDRDE